MSDVITVIRDIDIVKLFKSGESIESLSRQLKRVNRYRTVLDARAYVERVLLADNKGQLDSLKKQVSAIVHSGEYERLMRLASDLYVFDMKMSKRAYGVYSQALRYGESLGYCIGEMKEDFDRRVNGWL